MAQQGLVVGLGDTFRQTIEPNRLRVRGTTIGRA